MTKLQEDICDARHPCDTIKKFTGFSRMSLTTICCVWGALLLDSMLIDAFCLHITHLIDFLTCAHSKHYRRIVMSVGFTLEKLSLFSVSFVAYCLIFCMCGNQSEGMYQPLTMIPFKIRENNSLK